MISIALLYLFSALYFDNVFSANRGTSQPYLFFLSPTYWLSFCRISIKNSMRKVQYHHHSNKHGHFVIPSNSNHIIEKHHKKSFSTAVEEREYIQKLEEDGAQCNGVRLLGLTKTYEGSLGS
jgi:hypothetical protein